MEIWDAYKQDGTLAGCDLIRGEAIPKGLFHLVSEIIVKHKDGMYLLMQRDWKKPNFPGLYEASAGGSAIKGEEPYAAAIRELKEETGVEAKELKQIYKCMSKETIFYGYLCETDCDKESITLQEGETISYLWLTKEDFLKFVESDKYVQSYKERMSIYLDSIR
ncbi:NUDIX domain-containing protein [Clostridium sp.]|uniref:NUDIX hydrolase n=1 Tax=Clostridium sp. TaxID=1506 RepID=UPI00260719CB|nr:NUDIX domain-containing protein [Clostridium sp.]